MVPVVVAKAQREQSAVQRTNHHVVVVGSFKKQALRREPEPLPSCEFLFRVNER
jgi:hypothetical protein